MDLGLKDKVVIVTGGTRGIGAAIVDAFAYEGAKIAFCARTADQVTEKVKQLTDQGVMVLGDVVDVQDKASYLAWIDHVAGQFGGVDIFIPNVSGGAKPGLKGWQAAFEIDLMASVMGAEQVLRHMHQSTCAAITLITTISGLEKMGGPSAYGALKAGLVSYAGMLSETAGPLGIRVNAVSPGPIHIDDGFWGEVKRINSEQYEAIEHRHHQNRLGTPEEVAAAVLFLSSPVASWITGTNLIIDGGYSKRIQF